MKYITSKEVCERLKISKRTLHRWEQREKHPFPAPVFGGTRGSQKHYLTQEVENWENQLKQLSF